MFYICWRLLLLQNLCGAHIQSSSSQRRCLTDVFNAKDFHSRTCWEPPWQNWKLAITC